MARTPNNKRRERQAKLREQLWPDVDEAMLWKRNTGFINIPRTMPIMLSIMDDMADGRPVSAVYLELWSRAFEEPVVNLSHYVDMAFHSGFSGQRAVRTWRERMQRLAELEFIDVKPGPAGDFGYALIFNPYIVLRSAHDTGVSGVRSDKYTALLVRASEIGATDLSL